MPHVCNPAGSSGGPRWGSGPATDCGRGGGTSGPEWGVCLYLARGSVRGERPCWSACLADPCPPADPSFIHAELIPDSAERNDDKLYFFFRERSAEAPQSPAVYARIGRICLVRASRPPTAAPPPPRCPSPHPLQALAALLEQGLSARAHLTLPPARRTTTVATAAW